LLKELQNFLEHSEELLSKPKIPQPEGGNYYSRTMLERERIVFPEDTPDLIDKKIRGFYCPPHKGAAIILGDKEYELKYEEKI
jgi:methionyl-tRNA formyltransferase